MPGVEEFSYAGIGLELEVIVVEEDVENLDPQEVAQGSVPEDQADTPVPLPAAADPEPQPVSDTPEQPKKRRGRPPKSATADTGVVNGIVPPDPTMGEENPWDIIEIWEATTPSIVRLEVKDELTQGWKSVRVSTTRQARVTLSVAERRYNQGQVTDRNKAKHDPFTNGKLVCISGDPEFKTVSDDDLLTILKLDSTDLFYKEVQEIQSENNLRRLVRMAEKKATVERWRFIRDYIMVKYKKGSTQQDLIDMIPGGADE